MSLFITVLKCILCVEDDEDTQIRYQPQRSFDCNGVFRQIMDCILCERQSYRDRYDDIMISSTAAPLMREAKSGQTTSSSRVHNELNPSQTKSTYNLSREAIDNNSVPIWVSKDVVVMSSARDVTSDTYASKKLSMDKNPVPIQLSRDVIVISGARDAVSRSYASRQSSITNRETIDSNLVSTKLPGNGIAKSKSSAVSGNNKDASVTSQFAFTSVSSIKPPSVTSKSSLSSTSEKIDYNLSREAIDNNSVPIRVSKDVVVMSSARDVTSDAYASKKLSMDKNPVPIQLSRDVIVISGARDAVSRSYASRQSSITNRETIDSNLVSTKLPGNGIAKSKSSAVSGNNKDASVTSQFAFTSVSSIKPPSVTSKSSLSSTSEKIDYNLSREAIDNNSVPIRVSKDVVVMSSARDVTSDAYASKKLSMDKNPVPIQLSRDVIVISGARDAVSRSYASRQSSITNRETIDSNLVSTKLPGNGIAKSKSSAVSGNNKDASVTSQFAFTSVSSIKPPSVTSKSSLSSTSEKPSEISQKPKNLREDANKGTNISKDERHSYNASTAASKQLLSSMILPISSDCFKSSPSAAETEKYHSALKTDKTLSSSSFERSHSPKPPPISIKPTLSLAPSSSLTPQGKTKYIWVEKDASSTYVFPKDIKSLIEKDIVPGVLKMPLSKSSYKDYFHALLYAEDCHLEKWDGFEMEDRNVELHKAAIYTRRGKNRNLNLVDDKDEKVFVAFEIDKIPERRPFLLSRDFVSLKPSNREIKPFQGVIYRVVKSNLVLAEFEEKFYSQHHPDCKYDVKFSFNRVCLKRAHQAIAAASDHLLRNILFPVLTPKHELSSTELSSNYKYQVEDFAVRQILRLHGAPPYLVEGPISVADKKHLSKTGVVIVEAVLRILRSDPSKRILLCAPVNGTCDVLMRGLKKEMAESDVFRANATFREIDGVPMDILSSSLYEEDKECFSCPSLVELKKYKVILSTFMSSFRLYGEGIKAGHFSHIFLVDASSATEPETMVPLANFVNDTTIVVVTGAPRNHSGWVRSKIARENGLMTSYFERLRGSGMYEKLDPKFITQLENTTKGGDGLSFKNSNTRQTCGCGKHLLQ